MQEDLLLTSADFLNLEPFPAPSTASGYILSESTIGSLGLVTGLDLALLIAQVGMHPTCAARVAPGPIVIRWATELYRLRLRHDSFLAGTPAYPATGSLSMDLVVPAVLDWCRSSAVPHMFRKYPGLPSSQAVQADLALRTQRAAEGRPFRNTDLKQLAVALPYSPDLHGNCPQ